MIKKPKRNDYVDNEKLTSELEIWAKRQRKRIENGDDMEMIPPYTAQSILDICTNIARRPNFINYPFKDEMVGDAIECCVRYVKNFNGEKSRNAFGYISMIAASAIIRRIKKEKLLLKKHLRFIKGIVDVNELSEALNNAPEKTISHYNGYIDNMKSVLDDLMKDDEPVVDEEESSEELSKLPKKGEPTILEIMMNEGD